MEKMRADAFTDLNLKDRDAPLPLGPEGAMLLASFLPVMGALTSLDVRSNNIAGDGAAQPQSSATSRSRCSTRS